MTTDAATDQRSARARAFEVVGATPQGAPDYRSNMTMGLWIAKYFPAVAKWRKRMVWARSEHMDGPFDATDLMPPGATEPAKYPAYYFMQPVHTYPTPGGLDPAFGPFVADFNAKSPFYFGKPETTRYWLEKAYPGFTTGRVLDIGCGVGPITFVMAELWPDAEIIGIDLSPSCIRWARRESEARRLKNVAFYHVDGGDMRQFADASFDIVNEGYVLHEVPTYHGRAVVHEMIRVAKPGSTLTWFDWPPAETEGDLIRRKLAVERGSEPFMLQYLDLRLEPYLHEIGLEEVERLVRVGASMIVRARKPAS
jgi:SAM-dependent methyltransferase